MATCVTTSRRSKKLIGSLCLDIDDPTLRKWSELSSNEIDRDELVAWLKQQSDDQAEAQLLLESLRAALLEDLHESLTLSDERRQMSKRNAPRWYHNVQFYLLATAGALLAICAGYSGITAILGTFAVPAAIAAGFGVIFAGVSLAFFYHFDRVEMSKIFGTKLGQPRQMLDVCLNQVLHIKNLRKDIDERYAKTVDSNELQALLEMVKMLSLRYQALDCARQAYTKKLNNPYFKAVKIATATIEGGLVLAGGFFAGKSIALAIAGLFVVSVSATFWPILVASIVLSLAALSVYCVMQRPGYENRIGRLLGVDKTKIDAFADSSAVRKQNKKLQNLEKRIEEKLDAQQQIEQLHKKINAFKGLDKATEPVFACSDNDDKMAQKPQAVGHHAFFKRSLSLNDLSLDRGQQRACDFTFG